MSAHVAARVIHRIAVRGGRALACVVMISVLLMAIGHSIEHRSTSWAEVWWLSLPLGYEVDMQNADGKWSASWVAPR